LLSAELRENPTVFPPEEVLARCGFIHKATRERENQTNAGMKRIFDAIHRLQGSGEESGQPGNTEGGVP
jgi:hypothetical protein